jgi:signal transduction histidine kinase
MTFDFPVYSLAYLVNTGLTLGLSLAALRRRRTPGALAFAGIMLAASLWSFAQFLESGSTTVASKLFWSQVQYIGVVAVAPLWFLFAVRYTRSRLLDGWRVWLLAIIPLTTLALTWTTSQHGLVWDAITLVPGDPNVAIFSHGLWFWVHALFSYVMVISGSVLLVRESMYAPRIRQFQTLALVAGALAPLVANLIYLGNLLALPGIDLTSFSFTLSGAIFLPTLFGLRALDLMPVARGAIVEQMGDAVLVLDNEGRIVDLNPAVGALLGRPTSLWMGQQAATALAAWPELAACVSADAPTQSLVELAAEPALILDIRMATLKDSANRAIGCLLLLRDVTQLRLAERRAFDLALEQERVRLLSRFIRDASHEFRTPLTVVNTSLYLLDRQTEPAQQRAQRDKIAAQVERLNALIDDMLTMSKLDEGESFALTAIAINPLLAGIIEAGCSKQDKPVTVVTTLDADLPPVRGDAVQLHRAFTNLFCNAVRFSVSGGTVEVSTAQRDGMVVVTLHDTGVGIDPADHDRIFERFFRADDEHTTTGIGLGLPIARAIIEAHGGVIEVESTPGKGSTFVIQLPASGLPDVAESAASRRLAQPLRPAGAPAVETP